MSADGALECYLRDATSWDIDRTVRATRNEARAWWVAAAGWLCAVVAVATLFVLLPLKSVEPFVVRVDNSTGIVDVVPIYAGHVSQDAAVTRYFLTHYILTCERFNAATAESDYQECGSFHTAQRNQAWYALWNRTNPASPLNLHRDGSRVQVEVASVSFISRASGIADLAQVRYRKAESRGSDGPEQVTHWIATIEYTYTSPSQDPSVRRWNPLGFKIVELASEPEALGAPDSSGRSTESSR